MKTCQMENDFNGQSDRDDFWILSGFSKTIE